MAFTFVKEFVPAVAYTLDGKYVTDFCTTIDGTQIAIENLLLNGYADAEKVTVAIYPGGSHGIVECDYCQGDAPDITEVAVSKLYVCKSCRTLHNLTAV